MLDSPDTLTAEPDLLHGDLICTLCGATRACPFEALVRYSGRGWPQCCGEVMALLTEHSREHGGVPPVLVAGDPSR